MVGVGIAYDFQDMVSVCSPGCPGIHSVTQAGLKSRDQLAPGSGVPAFNLCLLSAGIEGMHHHSPGIWRHPVLPLCCCPCLVGWGFVCLF